MSMHVQENPALPAGLDPALQRSLVNWMHQCAIVVNRLKLPVGSLYVTVTPTNPAITLGYGQWSAFGTGRVLVGVDTGDADFDTVMETGGSKTATF